MDIVTIENIAQTCVVFIAVMMIGPKLCDEPPTWVQALIVIPGMISAPVLVVSALFLIWGAI